MFDPMTFWMQSSVFWMRIIQQQQEAYLRTLCAFAANMPHENAADLAREAEAMKQPLRPTRSKPRAVQARKEAQAQRAMAPA